MREPLCINMPDEESCETCVIANVLYMYGVVNKPDLAWIDHELGRKPGEPLDGGAEIDFLLKIGFCVHQIIKNQFDEQRFLREGLPYLRKFLGRRWTKSHTRFWTQAMVAQRQRSIAKSLAIRDQFKGRLTFQAGKEPTVDDIRQQLAQGRVVDASFGSNAICHATLVWQYTEQNGDPHLLTYYPAEQSSFLALTPRLFIKKGWNPHLGISAYWLPKA